MTVKDPAYKAFVARLKRARREAGLKQVEVADQLGKPQSYIAKSEAGDRRVDVVELLGFARLYRKPLDWFVADVAGQGGPADQPAVAVDERKP